MNLTEIIMAILGGDNMPAPTVNPLAKVIPGASLNTLGSIKRLGATKRPGFVRPEPPIYSTDSVGVRG